MLWVNAEVIFPDRDWDAFLADEENQVQFIESEVRNCIAKTEAFMYASMGHFFQMLAY